MFSRSSANKEEDSSNGGGGGGQAGSSGGSRSTSGSMFGFFSGSSNSSTNPSSSSKKKEKPLPLRPPESLPPQQYHRYAPHPSRPSPPHPDHLPSSSSRRAASNSHPHSNFDDQAPPPRARTSSRPPYSPTQSSQPLPGAAHDSAAAVAPHRTTHHSRNKSSSGLTTENRGSSPPRQLADGDAAVVDKDAAPAEEPWEREARLMREERAERAKGHRISNSLDRKPLKLTIDPQAAAQPRDQFHIPSFPFQAPTPTTALSTHTSMPSLASELALLATEPPKQDPSLPPPALPIPTPAPVPPPPPPSAAWGNLLSLSSAQTKSNSHNSSSSMFGPPVFSSSRPRRAASPPPPAPPARSSSPPPPPPPPPETKRSASNPLAVQTPLEPPAAISQPPPSSSPKWKSLLPRGPNANVHAPTEESTSIAPRPPFLSSHKASSSIGEPSSTQATASPWENLLALSSAAGPSTIHGPPIFHLPASNPSTPPATAPPPPPPSSSSDINPPPASQYHTTNPWENLMAAAANGTTPPIPSTSSSSTRPPHSKSSHKQPSHPAITSPPPPPSSSSRHKPSNSIGGGGLLVPAPNLLSKREDRTGPLGGVPSGSGSGSGGIGITGFVKGGNGDGSKGKGKPEMSTSPCICCSATLQYPKTVSSFRCTVCGTITDTDLSSRRAAGLPKQSDPFPLSINRFRALLDSARNASNAPSSPSASSFNLEDYESDDEVEEARTIEGDSGEEEEREREGTRGGGGEEGRRRRRSGGGGGGGLRLEVQEEKNKEKEEWWRPLEAELFAVFSHWSSLSGSFSNGVEPSIFDPGVDMIELRAFYELLSILPSELGQAVVKGLEGLLRRPRRRFDSGLGPKGLSWVLIVLENPLLFRNGSNESQAAGSVIKRFLGFVSNLANDQHHYLVHWFCRLYTAEEFQRRVELINITLVPRIRKHMQASDVAPALRASKPLPYLHDWKFRSAARTLSLFYAANALSQQIPVSSFYITLLDNLDVVADYECWIRTASTSSKSAFFLSQYPFLLSLGAKLKVLVHDSKKQQQQAQSSIDPSDGRRLVQPHITIRVRRDRLLEDSLNQISSSIHHLKRALRIEFAGEEGVDAGGLKKEWFLLLVRELLDPRYGMWLTDEDSGLCWFNPASLESAEQYTLIGVVVGLAVYHASVLDIPLPGAAFKRLLNKPVTIDDLAEWQPALARGLKNLLKFDGDVETVFCRSFVGEYESYGEIISVPLIPGGADIPVTEKNREEYVDRLVQFLLVDSVSRQFKAFQRGWLSVCEGNALSLFHAEEIELLVRGSPEALDVGQLRSVTVLDGFSPSDPLIESLWALIGSFEPQEQRKFLAFVTGSDRIPATGVGAMVFRVQANNHPLTHLPTTHTCFNLLSLPRYRSRSALNKKLVEAVGMSSGFGLK